MKREQFYCDSLQSLTVSIIFLFSSNIIDNNSYCAVINCEKTTILYFDFLNIF